MDFVVESHLVAESGRIADTRKRYSAGVLKHRQKGYWDADEVPMDTDTICLYRITPQEGVDPVEAGAAAGPDLQERIGQWHALKTRHYQALAAAGAGVTAARAAGIPVVAVRSAYTRDDDLSGALAEFGSLDDVDLAVPRRLHELAAGPAQPRADPEAGAPPMP